MVQYEKYSPAKFGDFVYFLYLRTRKPMTFETNVVGFTKTYAKYMQVSRLAQIALFTKCLN